MSKNYVIFDKKPDSVTVSSFVDEGLWASESFCGKNLFELGFDGLENARLSRALSVPLVEEFCGQSPRECESGGEDSEEIDVLMNIAEDVESTAESSEGYEKKRISEPFQILREMVGLRESIDTVDVFEQTIRCIKKLEMELRCSFC